MKISNFAPVAVLRVNNNMIDNRSMLLMAASLSGITRDIAQSINIHVYATLTRCLTTYIFIVLYYHIIGFFFFFLSLTSRALHINVGCTRMCPRQTHVYFYRYSSGRCSTEIRARDRKNNNGTTESTFDGMNRARIYTRQKRNVCSGKSYVYWNWNMSHLIINCSMLEIGFQWLSYLKMHILQ